MYYIEKQNLPQLNQQSKWTYIDQYPSTIDTRSFKKG